MKDQPQLSSPLAQFISWMQIHVPEVKFLPPATQAAIVNFIKKSGQEIPEDLHQTLLTIDGESLSSAGAIGNWRLMSIAEIQAAWGWLTRLAEKGAFAEQKPKTSPYIRPLWWHAGWIPIVSSDTGDYFCVDTDPLEPSRQGQVLLFIHNQPERILIAGSLPAWFDRIVRDLKAGIYHYTQDVGFNIEAFMWSALEGKHYFDGGEGKLVVRQ